MIKAVFFDMDGTLLSFKTHSISLATRESLDTLREQGIKVFLATGRQMKDALSMVDFVFDGYVTFNGGYCTIGQDEVILRHCIAEEDIERLIEWQKGPERFACTLEAENDSCLNFEDDRVKEIMTTLKMPNPPRIASFDEWSDVARRGVLQVMGYFGSEDESRLMREVFPNSQAPRWHPTFTDIVPIGVDKAKGIDHILERFGIGLDETMAIGDGGNDISMLKHVGIGVAMGNADPLVKQAANYVTQSVDENGVVQALRHFGLIK